MPELPEVETIVRDLRRPLAGRTIAGVDLVWPGVLDRRGEDAGALLGERIAGVRRLGKFIVVRFASGKHAAVHLRMTGRLIADPPALSPYARFIWRFADGGRLVFEDVRKFGRLRVFADKPNAELGVGIDPFDRRLDERRLQQMTAKRRTPIKTWLLDQKRVAGVGNIYACEALYRARIRPSKAARRLSRDERRRLLAGLRKVLTQAIASRGSSVDDYVDGAGLPGGFQNLLTVYGRRGLPCRRCKTPIRRIVLAQRGTFYCPHCQR